MLGPLGAAASGGRAPRAGLRIIAAGMATAPRRVAIEGDHRVFEEVAQRGDVAGVDRLGVGVEEVAEVIGVGEHGAHHAPFASPRLRALPAAVAATPAAHRPPARPTILPRPWRTPRRNPRWRARARWPLWVSKSADAGTCTTRTPTLAARRAVAVEVLQHGGGSSRRQRRCAR